MYVLGLLLLVLFFNQVEARAQRVRWTCNLFAHQDSKVSPSKDFDLEFEERNGSYSLKGQEIMTFLNSLQSQSIDLEPCISEFVQRNLARQVNRFCSGKNPKSCNGSILKPFQSKLADLSSSFLASPHFPLNMPLAAETLISMYNLPEMAESGDLCSIRLDAGTSRATIRAAPKLLMDQSPNCRSRFASEIIDHLSEVEIPDSCAQNKNHEVCLKIQKQLKQAVSEIQPLLGMSNDQLKEVHDLCDSNVSNAFLRLKNLAQEIVEAESCRELDIGSSRRVDPKDFTDVGVNVGSVPPSPYIVKRTSEKVYKVELNLEFEYNITSYSQSSGILSRTEAPLNPSFMKERAKTCLSQANNKELFKGPKGEVLKISIDSKSVNPTIITVSPPMQSDYLNWDAGIECPAIVHEILHHFGLCDEYDNSPTGELEKQMISQKQIYWSDCRAVGPEDSIMGGQARYRWDLSMGTIEKPLRTPKTAAPFFSINPDGSFSAPLPYRIDNGNPNPTDVEVPLLTSGDTKSKLDLSLSLLEPNHGNIILYPGCKSKNSDYYACSASAYRSSHDRKTGKFIGCPELPDSCAKGKNGKFNTDWLRKRVSTN